MEYLNNKLVLYHACEQTGGIDSVSVNAPFLSEDNARQWLTRGYYFWVEDIVPAQQWGANSVKGSYAIVKCDAEYAEEDILDLVSSPLHIKAFKSMLSQYMNVMREKCGCEFDPTVSECINYFRSKNLFKFKGIIAAEEQDPAARRRKFIKSAGNFIALNARQQFCLFEGSEDIIMNKCIVEPAAWAA